MRYQDLSRSQLMDFLIRGRNETLQVGHVLFGARLCQLVLGTFNQTLAVRYLLIDGQFGYGIHIEMVQLQQ